MGSFAISSSSFILKVGDDGALLVPPRSAGYAAPVYAEHNDNTRTAAILDTLKNNPRTPVILAADTLGQDYKRDVLPRLNILDRRKLVSRRLQDYFPAHEPGRKPVSTALRLNGKETLFVGVHHEGPLAAWLEHLESCPNALVGIVPLPLAVSDMAAGLLSETAQGWCLMLSYHRTGGFRQIVTRDGSFAFTRMTSPVRQEFSPAMITASLAVDMKATVDYLVRLGLKKGEKLPLIAILPRAWHGAVEALPDPFKVVAAYTPCEAAHSLGLALTPSNDDSASDELFTAWIGRRTPRPLLMTDTARERLKTSRIRKIGTALAVAILFTGIGNLGWRAHDLREVAEANRTAAHNVALLREQWVRERAELAPVTEPLGRLRQAVARQRLFTETDAGPWPLLQTLAENIGASGRLTRFVWNRGEKNGAPETLVFSLRLTDGSNDERQNVVRRIDNLVLALRAAQPNYEIAVTRYPFLVKPDDTLSNADDKTSAEPLAELRLRKVKP